MNITQLLCAHVHACPCRHTSLSKFSAQTGCFVHVSAFVGVHMFASARVLVNLCTHVSSYMLTLIHTQSVSSPLSLSHSHTQRVCKNLTVAEQYFKQCLLINPRYLHANSPKLSESGLVLHNSQKQTYYPYVPIVSFDTVIGLF